MNIYKLTNIVRLFFLQLKQAIQHCSKTNTISLNIYSNAIPSPATPTIPNVPYIVMMLIYKRKTI